MKIGNREFSMENRTYIMGILNVTPDSFSDGGRFQEKDRALFHVEEMLRDGMDILDIGGESTRPGHKAVPEEEELERTLPVLEAVKKRFEIPISLDTCKASVAKAGIAAGADLINDVWGLKQDGEMGSVIAASGLPCCLMHNRTTPAEGDFIEAVGADLAETIRLADRAGIAPDRIILDPGIGFGKTFPQNLEMLNHLEQLKGYGYPILLGTSRKSVIGLALNLPADQRMEGTLVTTVFGVLKGCSFVRVHDVKENRRAVDMAEAILYGRRV